jgi:gamma-glutamyl:cysteine ligase YbdK (ATP-grasp superfamily)
MFTNLRQYKTLLLADVPVGEDADGRVTLHITVPTLYVRIPDQPLEARVRLAIRELNDALTALGAARLLKLRGEEPASPGAEADANARERVQQAHENVIIACLDEAGLPDTVGRNYARIALKGAGVPASSEVLRAALKRRQARDARTGA